MQDSKFTFAAPPVPPTNGNKPTAQVERPSAQSFYNFKNFMKTSAPPPTSNNPRRWSDDSESEDGEADMDLQDSDNFISFDTGPASYPAAAGVEVSQRVVEKQPSIITVDPFSLKIPTPGWIDKDRRYSSNILNFLQQEVEDFCRFMEPTKSEIALRKLTVARLGRVVENVFKSYSVYHARC